MNDRHRTAPALAGLGLAVAVLATATPARATESAWSVSLQSLYMDVYGHDQHVLTVHQLDVTAPTPLDADTAVRLDSEAGFAYRTEVRYRRGHWTWGLDLFSFRSPQKVATASAAAAGPGRPVAFEVADRAFVSTGQGEVLFFTVLEDTTIELWTLDLFALRTLAESEGSALELQLGLRNGDFDNDYRAAAGIEGVGGVRHDASSNYDRMMGPLVGLAGRIEAGRSTWSGYLGGSLLLGSVDKLTHQSRDFVGPFSENPDPTFIREETFSADQDVAIPIGELRLEWSLRLGEHLSLGTGVHAAVWWDVPVPPGVVVSAGADALDESTLVFAGLMLNAGWTF